MKRRVRRIVIAAGIIAASAYVFGVAFVWWNQDSMVFAPRRGGYSASPTKHGLRHQDIALEVSPGVTVKGWLVHAKGTPRATILYLHGSGGNLSNSLSAIRTFAAADFDSFSIDYEGYGDSKGSPSEANTYRDCDAAWSWLTSERGIHPREIAIWGASLGGGVATYCAETHAPGALVLQGTFTSLPDLGARLYFWLPARLIARNVFDNVERLPKIQAPVIVAHSRDDDLIPFDMGQSLFEAAQEPKVFVELTGGHGESMDSTEGILKELGHFF